MYITKSFVSNTEFVRLDFSNMEITSNLEDINLFVLDLENRDLYLFRSNVYLKTI